MSETSSRLIIRSQNEVLMSMGDTGSVKFLGGRLQKNESPHNAAVREALEEGGIDLSRHTLYELPYQENDSKRPSFWFGVNTERFAIESLKTGDDVTALFWVSLANVESQLTYDAWKEHWTRNLLPYLQ